MSVVRRRNNAYQSQISSWQGLDESSFHTSSDGGYYEYLHDTHPSTNHQACKLGLFGTKLPRFSSKSWLLLVPLLVLAPWVRQYFLSQKLQQLQQHILDTQQSHQSLAVDIQRLKIELGKTMNEGSDHEKISHQLLAELHDRGTVDTDSLAYREGQEIENKYLQRINEIESSLAKKYESMATVKHGNGPYHVVVSLQEEPLPGAGKFFVIETLPKTAMPLTVGHFLHLVEHDFYNGLSLSPGPDGAKTIRTTDTVLRETRSSLWASTPELLHLPFTENSSAHPVHKYSVAFESKTRGPYFYINMGTEPSSEEHPGEAYFGKVVQGMTVLEAMLESQQIGHSTTLSIEHINILPNDVTK